METLRHLKALLKHEVEDLVSVEDQIIEAMPAMIGKASDNTLKKSLQQHLKITQQQRKRLDKVQKLLNQQKDEEPTGKKKGLFSRLMGSSTECKGMKGIIQEAQKIMKEDMSSPVMDAAIIAAAQKVEHYEICGYGTAKAYARELGLTEVEQLLDQTLSEEYEADDKLTELAVRRINKEAERGAESGAEGRYWSRSSGGAGSKSATSRSESRSSGSGARTGSQPTKTASRSAATSTAKKSSGSKSTQKTTNGSKQGKKATAGKGR